MHTGESQIIIQGETNSSMVDGTELRDDSYSIYNAEGQISYNL